MEFENLLTLIKTVSDSKLTDLKYEENGVKLHLTKNEGPFRQRWYRRYLPRQKRLLYRKL